MIVPVRMNGNETCKGVDMYKGFDSHFATAVRAGQCCTSSLRNVLAEGNPIGICVWILVGKTLSRSNMTS